MAEIDIEMKMTGPIWEFRATLRRAYVANLLRV
jgi:hypothetical protein